METISATAPTTVAASLISRFNFMCYLQGLVVI